MKTIFYFILISISMLIYSCAEEGDIFEEDFQNNNNLETTLIIDYINQEFVVSNEASSCFTIDYPITLITNTKNEVTIENNQGFKQFVASLSSGFHVTGINFPIQVNSKELNRVEEFRNQMIRCEIATFRSVINENNTICFEFKYPLSVFDNNKQLQFIEGKENYKRFIINQGVNYEPLFKYPISVNTNLGLVNLESNFDFYKVINACNNNCNNFEIAKTIQDQDVNFRSNFEIDPSTENAIESIEWFVNSELQVNESAKVYVTIFEEVGDYEVCAKVKFANCLQKKQVCVNTTISESQLPICKQIAVIASPNAQIQGQYDFLIGNDRFSSEFANSMYKWTINDEIQIDFERSSFDFEFREPGEYEICAELINNDCPNSAKACTVLVLNADQVAN